MLEVLLSQNVNLQPTRRTVTEMKMPLPKSMNKKNKVHKDFKSPRGK